MITKPSVTTPIVYDLKKQVHDEQRRVADIVEDILRSDERARNSDLWLILQVWQKAQQVRIFVPYERLGDMIAPESITRARRVIQNERCVFLPTDASVLRRRRFKQDALTELFSSDPRLEREFYSVQ